MKSAHSYIRSLPTKADFELCVKRIEKNYRQKISELKRDIGARFEDMETTTVACIVLYISMKKSLTSTL